MKNELAKQLMETFDATYLKVMDQSHLHAGHFKGPKGGGTHFDVTLCSDVFTGTSKVQRHRQIYKACDKLIKAGIHALAIHAYTMNEWDDINGK